MVIYMEKKAIKQWITEDEKEHFPCAKEWWCAEGFFTTGENNKKWSFKADLTQAVTRAKLEVSIYSITLFDLDNPTVTLTTKDTKGTPEGATAAAAEPAGK